MKIKFSLLICTIILLNSCAYVVQTANQALVQTGVNLTSSYIYKGQRKTEEFISNKIDSLFITKKSDSRQTLASSDGVAMHEQAILLKTIELDNGITRKKGSEIYILKDYKDGTFYAEDDNWFCKIDAIDFVFVK